jgi:hypothetical protein
MEGYEMAGTLTAEQHVQIDRLRLLIDVTQALEEGDPAVLAGLPAAVMARLDALREGIVNRATVSQ